MPTSRARSCTQLARSRDSARDPARVADGYKVYWGNGAQIIPPHDAGIASGIEESLEPWASYGDYATADALLAAFSDLATACTEELRPLYYEHFTSELCRYPTENATSAPVVYTAMHGVGAPWFSKGFDAFHLPPPIPVVQQQAQPTRHSFVPIRRPLHRPLQLPSQLPSQLLLRIPCHPPLHRITVPSAGARPQFPDGGLPKSRGGGGCASGGS